ncbi:methyl-accepting chemotaxis protein [Campylobacter hyointestinalis]|uniref:hypothetical protein n=1 Tax=Campylobacter hyointestinalis TaxID=198 RepID=UPI0007294B82|nr:hypothetical protein [Campylobacter hyointestinalis]CUU83852.1 methyl-accepting chemotaxis protein [Campylobacter hyointestinalis]
MKRKSIAGKVSFGVSLLFIILLAILSYINYSDSKANTTELLVNEREKVTQSAESLLKTQFGDDINTVESLAKLLGSSNYSNEEVEKTLKVIENSSNFDLMFVGYQNDGMMIRSNGNLTYLQTNTILENVLGIKKLSKKTRLSFQSLISVPPDKDYLLLL